MDRTAETQVYSILTSPPNDIIQLELIADVMLAPRRRLLGNEDDRQLIANYTCEDETQVQYCYYPRYWHGYLTVLKPLLLFFSTEDLHLIYFFVQSCLLLSLTAALIKKNQLPLAVCFGIGVLLLNPMVTALNFQNASIYLILLLITSGILYAMLTVRKAKFTSNWLCRNFSTALVALYPFCHMLASTHTYYHYFFVYREFVITILAVFFLILDAENLKLEKSPV